MMPFIQIQNLHKHYWDGSGNRLEILKGIEVVFNRNKMVAIVGRSGSGKSTLLHLLGGLDHPTEGEILFEDENIFGFNSARLSNWRNRHIGFVFQAHHLMPDFTALENVMAPAMIAGQPKKSSQNRANALLDLVELNHRKNHKPTRLSGGEQQRVAIARALVNNPELILADEPTGNLDDKTGAKIELLLQKICREQNATLIIVTHNIQLAASMDCQYQLSDGKLAKA